MCFFFFINVYQIKVHLLCHEKGFSPSWFLLLWADYGLPQYIICFCPVPSFLCISSFTTSTKLIWVPPLLLLPGSSIFSILYLIYPPSLPCTCPKHLSLSSKMLDPSGSSDVLISKSVQWKFLFWYPIIRFLSAAPSDILHHPPSNVQFKVLFLSVKPYCCLKIISALLSS